MDKYLLSRSIIAYKPREGVAVGYVFDYIGDEAPDGWLMCEGQTVSQHKYAELYAVIGDAYGRKIRNLGRKWYQLWKPKFVNEILTGQFRLPDFRGRVHNAKN